MIRLFAGHCDLTDDLDRLEWSSSDPGGMEIASFEVPNDVTCPTPGAPVVISDGFRRPFIGRVEEPGDNFDEQRAPGQIGAVGAGAVLKDNDVSVILLDRDLTRWQPSTNTRRRGVLESGSLSPLDHTVVPDEGGEGPAIAMEVDAEWVATARPLIEAWYDAGSENLVGELRADWRRASNTTSTNWTWLMALVTANDGTGTSSATGDLQSEPSATGSATITTAGGSYRYGYLEFIFSLASANSNPGIKFGLWWTNVLVLGDHGIDTYVADNGMDALEPADVMRWLIGRLGGDLVAGVIEDSGVPLLQSAYYEPVPHEQVAADMGEFTGCHWGVWEPLSMLDDTPRLDFRLPATEATCTVRRSDCRTLRLAQRYSDLHNQARVKYSTVDGRQGSVLVARENPRIPAGVTRTAQLDAGVGDANYAATVGLYVLALESQQTRAAGEVELPPTVATSRGRMPSHLLQPGIDRLKITGLPNTGAWTDPDTRRYDTFRISRLRCQMAPGGAIRTVAEIDAGANLTEVLQARLAQAAGLAG